MENKKFISELKKRIVFQKKVLEKLENENDPSLQKELTEKIALLNNQSKKIINKINYKSNLNNPFGKTERREMQAKTTEKSIDLETEGKKEKELEGKKERGSNKTYKKVLKRIKKGDKEKKIKIKEKKPSKFIKTANGLFANYSVGLLKKGKFRHLKRDLSKANMQILPSSYISIIFFVTLLSVFAGIGIFLFFLFFNLDPKTVISMTNTPIGTRFLQTFWIMLAVPVLTFLFAYFYPSMEKSSQQKKIDKELPFVAIHMSAISGSMVELTNIFKIIIATHEYPATEKEFIKLINKINIYGYNLVGALKDCAEKTSSKKLAELMNGLATTITSGGDLRVFFQKRSQGLLFEYRLERERYTRTAETFMDIYISVVIAAPMIFMLLLVIMSISGLGIALGTGSITLLMILGVTAVNIIFLAFLHLKSPEG